MATTYHCPNCGASLTYGKSGNMECATCGSSFTFEQLNIAPEPETAPEYHADSHVFSEEETDSLRRYHCPTCGAGIVAGRDTAATECVYCGTPVVMDEEWTGVYRPDGVIPFKTDKNDAAEAFRKHCKGKRLLPNGFAGQSRIDKITGVYIPYWLYNCTAAPKVNYAATRVRQRRQGNYIITDTDHYILERGANMAFSDLPVSGSTLMPTDVMESIEPFSMKTLRDFTISYMSGYQAQKFDRDVTECHPRAEERVKRSITERMRATVTGYATVTEVMHRDNLRFGAARQVLMPVWMLNTVWKDKTYTFAMNGESGQFIGDLPTDTGKFFRYLLLFFAGFCALGTALVTVLHMLGVIL